MTGRSQTLVLIGGGGHARVVIDAAECAGLAIAGLLDENKSAGDIVDGVAVLGGNECLDARDAGGRRYHIAIAAPAMRQRLRLMLEDRRLATTTIVHPAAMVSRRATLGDGCFVAAGAIVNTGSRLASGVVVNTGAQIDHDADIGPDCHVGPGAVLCGTVRCGAGVFVGAGATVVQTISIGDGATVGAGATVVRDVPAGATVAGVPAKPLGPS